MDTRIAIFEFNKNIVGKISLLLKEDATLIISGIFDNVRNCVSKVMNSKPDVVLIDLDYSYIDGIKALKLLKTHFPALKILVQTSLEEDKFILDIISAGASGYILKKDLNKCDLISAIKILRTGGSPLSPSIARRIVTMVQQIYRTKPPQPDQYHLTRKETEVLKCLAKGLSYKQIQSELSISYNTVRTHIKNINTKLQTNSRTELVSKALKENLI
jgi:DNA-binding NarL/FixJ family response regulator